MPDIRKGFVTQVGMDAEEAIQKAGEFGFDYVEVMMDGENTREALEQRSDTIRTLLTDHDVALCVHLPFTVDIGSPHEHVRHGSMEEIRACIETAAALGVEKTVLHASSEAWSAAWPEDEIKDNILDGVREIDGAAVDHGVEICVENIPDGFFTVQDFPMLFDETDAAMTLDTGHARVDGMDGADVGEFVSAYGDRISHIHLNDTRKGYDDDHVPFGAGNFDFEPMFQHLRDGWTGTLSLEVFTPNWDYIAMSKEQLDEMI
ncbi:MAG: sugar phosphate isomerase/epimerase family protein [Candidatus Nanohaloarchaea archaeon]|nr:sugar phosphate isomerase/epimerase family protein [Candidatus Nanohaloarchaea archaeon]